MSQEEGSGGPELIGRPVEEAVEAVLSEDDSRDRGTVRATLETVTEDGVVSEAAIEAELEEVSKVVSTPETRVELAAMEVSEAKETAEAEGVSDLDTVRARIGTYESRLEAVEEAIGSLGPDLREVIDRRTAGANAYEVAAGLREVRAEANELHRTADELQVDAEEFGRWLTDPGTRYEELEGEIEAVERSLAALSGTADDLDADDDEGEGASSSLPAEPGVVWADASLRTRVTALLLADIEAELDDLRAWPGREGSDDRLDELGTRLGELEGECRDLEERLDDLARPAWTDRFGDRLDDLEDELDRFAPPVSWGEVEAELERHRETLGAA
jgi:chromosome segregation ATPase